MDHLIEADKRSSKELADKLKSSYRYDAYCLGKEWIIQIQDYPEQYPYLIRLSDTKYNRIVRLIHAPK